MNSWLYWITSDPELWPSSSSAQPFISLGDVRKMELWIPSIEEQKRIVGLMDKFSDLSSSASIGLPAEIQARRQQYEYYRNKLLTFKELKAS
jgi:type I restriction enzyme S subunit